MDKPKLLIVEDDEDLRTQMRWALAREYEVSVAGDRARALDSLKHERPALVTLDLGLPPHAQGTDEGFATLGEILKEPDAAKVVVITGRAEREHARRAVAMGAFDYFSKPIEVAELAGVLRRALNLWRLEHENRESARETRGEAFEGMLGRSPRMQEIVSAVRKVAGSDAAVLVLGESGSGKELVARAIHSQSPRREGPFVAINCGAIPENLLESELFGHEKGAFTGAHAQRKGRIEAAHKGTLFLDEIGELSPPLQVKLLRILQERQLERVGGRQPIAVDARVVTATNSDLKRAMETGRFREDLFYRIAVVTLSLPPLRERAGDVSLLGEAFRERFAQELGRKVTGFTSEALQAMEAYDWPGNVRELENRVRRAIVMAEGNLLGPADLELSTAAASSDALGLKEAREALERDTVMRALARNKGNMSRTAAELGVSRPTLYALVEKLGIERE